MTQQPVRDAYSTMSEQYIGLFGGDWTALDEDTALIRGHLTGLDGPVLDLGCGPGYWTADLHPAHGCRRDRSSTWCPSSSPTPGRTIRDRSSGSAR